MCVLSVYPWLPAPKGSISKLHLFEGFLIWGLGQPRSTVPSSIIPAEEQSGGEGVERRRKTGGDHMISYLSSRSPTRSIAGNFLSLHLFNLSLAPPAFPYLHPLLFLHLSWLLISLFLPLLPAFWAPACSASHPYVHLSIYLSVWLSDLSPDGGPFCVSRQMRMTFIVKQPPTGRDETTSV